LESFIQVVVLIMPKTEEMKRKIKNMCKKVGLFAHYFFVPKMVQINLFLYAF